MKTETFTQPISERVTLPVEITNVYAVLKGTNPEDAKRIVLVTQALVALVIGDLNVGADGTVTHIEGERVYAFGHRFLAVGATDLPFARSSHGLISALFKGWQLNNLTTIRSGHPFTVQLGFNRSGNLNTTSFSMNERPNLKAGCSSNPVLGGPDRYWDINCFELPAVNTRGNLGRNTLIGPGLINADLALVKSFGAGALHALQVRIEAFNVFNRANFAVPSGRIAFTGVDAQGNPIVAPTWGRITSTVTTAPSTCDALATAENTDLRLPNSVTRGG